MFTLDNVFDKRAEFEQACKKAKACKEEFSKLLKADTKAEFLKVLYENFFWVYMNVTQFGLMYDCVGYFNEGFVRVRIGDKYGFIDTKFKPICDVKYDYVGHFLEGFARVENAEKYGILDCDGKEVYEVKYTLDEVMELLKELRKCSH